MNHENEGGAIGFAEKVLALLEEGTFTATYKYAVLLGIMDLCLEHASRSGAAPAVVTTRQLAEKVLELYWPHTVPFPASAGPVLRQNTIGQAEILSAVNRFRTAAAPDSGASLGQARLRASERFEKLARLVEWKLIEMPLPRLQVMGNQDHRFIYDIAWDKNVRRAEVIDGSSFDNVDHFLPWARHPDNGIHNLVLADARCNNDKRHFLAAVPHVERWFERMALRAADMATIATRCSWEGHPERTLSVVRAVYLRLPTHAMLWSHRREFVRADRTELTRILAIAG